MPSYESNCVEQGKGKKKKKNLAEIRVYIGILSNLFISCELIYSALLSLAHGPYKLVWFLLFNRISTFTGYLTPKLRRTVVVLFNPSLGGDKEVHIFSMGINPKGGACGVMVIVIGNGHGHKSSNPGRG